MRIVVVGASRFGIYTAKKLIEKGHEVVLIDKNSERLEDIGEQLDCGLIHGDGSLPSVQREAFGDHADALVLLTNVDNVNILAAVVGRSVGFTRVIPQIVGSELLSVCSELDLDDIITPHQTVARSIVETLENDEQSIIDVNFDENLLIRRYWTSNKFTGKTIQNLELPTTCRVLGLVRDDTKSLVTQDTELKEDDCLIIIVEKENEAELETFFDKKE